MVNKPTRIIWHHSADTDVNSQFEKINQFHKSRNFPKSKLGFYGGYHYLIESSGEVRRYRLDSEIGAHAYGFNHNSIGICLAGNFDIQIPTIMQQRSFSYLLKALIYFYDIEKKDILPHRQIRKTACPGGKLYDTWAQEILNDQWHEDLPDFLLDIIKSIKSNCNAPHR